MLTYFDKNVYEAIGSPQIGDEIFIKRGRKKYYGNIISIGSKANDDRKIISINVKKVKEYKKSIDQYGQE